MRYSRMENTPNRKKSETGNRAVSTVMVLMVIGAIVYLAAAGMLGSFVSDNIVEPVTALFSTDTTKAGNADTPSTDNSTDKNKNSAATDEKQTSKTIEPEKYALYTLQLGVFSDEQNAKELATSSAAQGGAGYVMQQDDQYRVLLSAYKTEQEAKSVKEKLNDQNIETTVREMSCEPVSMSITSSEGVIASVQEAINNISKYIEQLRELSVEYDKDTSKKDEILTKLNDIDKNIIDTQNTVDGLAKESNDVVIKQLSVYYDKMSGCTDSLKKNKTDIELSSELKYAYLELFDEQIKLFKEMAN